MEGKGNLGSIKILLLLFGVLNVNSQQEIEDFKTTKDFSSGLVTEIVINEKYQIGIQEDPIIILNSVAKRRNMLPESENMNKNFIGKFEYFLFETPAQTNNFLYKNNIANDHQKIAMFGTKIMITDGTLILNYLNDNDLKDLEQDYSMIMKNVLPDSKIAVYRPLLIEDANQIVLSLRNDKRVSSVRLDFRDPLILPE